MSDERRLWVDVDKKCDNCKSVVARRACSRCRNCFYCSARCQRHHWDTVKHKDVCKDFGEQFKENSLKQSSNEFYRPEKACSSPQCPRAGGTLAQPAVLLPCQDHLCLDCLKQHKINLLENPAGDDEHVHGQCPSCLKYLEMSVEDLLWTHVQRLRDNSRCSSLPERQKEAFKQQAVAVLVNVLPELNSESFRGQDGRALWDETKVVRLFVVLAILHTDLKHYETAIELLRKMLRYADDNSENQRVLGLTCEIHRKLGKALEATKKWEEAIQHYEKALELDGGQKITNRVIEMKGGIAHSHISLGQIDQAEQNADEIFHLSRKHPGSHLQKSEILEDCKGEPEKANSLMVAALILEEPWNLEHRVKILSRIDKLEDTIALRDEFGTLEGEFRDVWGQILERIDQEGFDDAPKAWSTIRHRFEMGSGYDSDEEREMTDAQVRLAAARAATSEDAEDAEDIEDDDGDIDVLGEDEAMDAEVETSSKPLEYEDKYGGITVTKEVLKWHKECDPKFREMFVKKLQKLVEGDWGKTTAKLLVGSQMKIYETYLENKKGGYRILWVRPNGSIQIRYVVSHKKVSRFMRLIDSGGVRTNEQLFPASKVADDEVMGAFGSSKDYEKGEIQIDPRADVPLKLYEISPESIVHLNDKAWMPPLYMTPRENAIVQRQGSVCILGRSGTGKTVCIASRIHRDRHYFGANENFSQCFVARSRRICAMVADMVGAPESGVTCKATYWTYDRLLMRCEQSLIGQYAHHYTEKKKMTFDKFKSLVFPSDCSVDTLVAWKQIRTFIKGSIMAAEKGEHLTREQYLALGKQECRLTPEQRNVAYDVFERYKRFCIGEDYWDDIDRVTRILKKIRDCLRGPKEFPEGLVMDKLYVDEVQDYTQCELALFLRLCKNDGLFLAGDPAQSVEEGIDFRFEDVRMVADRIYNERSHEDLSSSNRKSRSSSIRANIPNKPEVLRVNFRSHAGVLHLASGILGTMSEAFKGSFKNLGEDEGFFRGPRPSVLSDLSRADLKELVMKLQGVAVLTLDESGAIELEEILGDRVNVLTIRESKGLEFDIVLIVNFFSDLSGENQQHWKSLLLEEFKSDIQEEAPEVETQLKLLYTGITRCCKRLIFAETKKERPSPAFEAFKKWGSIRPEKEEKARYVDLQSLEKIAENIMTSHDWTMNGIQFAMRAEESEDHASAKKNLKRALDSFREAGDDENGERAEIHLASIALREQLIEAPSSLENTLETLEPFVSGVANLIKCGLHLEASKFCVEVMERLTGEENEYSRQQIQERVLGRLPELDF